MNKIIKKEQNMVDGEIKYFRIGLNYRNLNDLKSICNISISYIKKNEKKISNLKVNILEFYTYLINHYEKKDVISYIKKICNKFYVPNKDIDNLYLKKIKKQLPDNVSKKYHRGLILGKHKNNLNNNIYKNGFYNLCIVDDNIK